MYNVHTLLKDKSDGERTSLYRYWNTHKEYVHTSLRDKSDGERIKKIIKPKW